MDRIALDTVGVPSHKREDGRCSIGQSSLRDMVVGAWGHFVCVSLCSVIQLCMTLCDIADCSPSGSSVHGIFQAIILEQFAISYSRRSFQLRGRTHTLESPALADGFFTTAPPKQ